MGRPIILPRTKRGRGNPNWCNPHPPLPAVLTEFERQVERLGLTKAQYVASSELRYWCERNRNRCYVPEWLLQEWGLKVEAIFSSVA
jgi:hypothetical protein